MSLITPAMADRLEAWLTHLAALDDASPATVTAYRTDLAGFLSFMGTYHGGAAGPEALRGLGLTDMRAWMAAERARGLSARSLARRLSAIRSKAVRIAASTLSSTAGSSLRMSRLKPSSPSTTLPPCCDGSLSTRPNVIVRRFPAS